MKLLSSERGSILLYSLLTLAVMLSIGVSMSDLFVSKFRTATLARETVTAIYIADGAAELCLYEARKETDVDGATPLGFQVGGAYALTASVPPFDFTANCSGLGSKSFTFRATGQFRNTRRTLEITQ